VKHCTGIGALRFAARAGLNLPDMLATHSAPGQLFGQRAPSPLLAQ
jgi:hypothetical protein